MEQNDTIQLLRECDCGTKIAVNSIDDLSERAKSQQLKEIFARYRKEHEAIGKRILEELEKYKETGKNPSSFVKAMSWLKIKFKLLMQPSDHTVADLMMDGCNMGIKSLCRYHNKYDGATPQAKELSDSLVRIEEQLMKELHGYV